MIWKLYLNGSLYSEERMLGICIWSGISLENLERSPATVYMVSASCMKKSWTLSKLFWIKTRLLVSSSLMMTYVY